LSHILVMRQVIMGVWIDESIYWTVSRRIYRYL
jgi:hypothetical protein